MSSSPDLIEYNAENGCPDVHLKQVALLAKPRVVSTNQPDVQLHKDLLNMVTQPCVDNF